jgi:LPS export ABC transporter protein LptC
MTRKIIALWFVMSVLVLSGCSEREESAPSPTNELPIQTIYGYHTVETERGQMRWELFGNRAERYAGEEDLHLIGVRMYFYTDGQLSATLTSKRGKVNENTRNMVAEGDVKIVTEDDRTLESEVLTWDNERRIISTDLYFRATDADKVLTGIGLETDPKMTDLVIKKQVEGDAPESSQGLRKGEQD